MIFPPSLALASALKSSVVVSIVSAIVAVALDVPTLKFSKFPPLTLVIVAVIVSGSIYTSLSCVETVNVPVDSPAAIVIVPNVVTIVTGVSPAGDVNVAVNVTLASSSFTSTVLKFTVALILGGVVGVIGSTGSVGVCSSVLLIGALELLFPVPLFSLPSKVGSVTSSLVNGVVEESCKA